jgi:hypothetical protein
MLSRDARLLLAEGLHEPGERLPDGPRYRAAVKELLETGFAEYRENALAVTPAGADAYSTDDQTS